jgi:hypothetical protein
LNLDLFIEDINTECSMLGNPSLSIQAIKVDAEGENSLKYRLCQNELKSCDYIKFTENKTYFIEFSDLYEQLKNLRVLSNAISNSNISDSEKRALNEKKVIIKEPTVIKNELQSKISESLLLFQLIADNYDITAHMGKNKIFFIALCKILISDIIMFDRILREIQNKFRTVINIEMMEYIKLEDYLEANS